MRASISGPELDSILIKLSLILLWTSFWTNKFFSPFCERDLKMSASSKLRTWRPRLSCLLSAQMVYWTCKIMPYITRKKGRLDRSRLVDP